MLQRVIFDIHPSVPDTEETSTLLQHLKESGLTLFFSFKEAKQAAAAFPSSCIVVTDSVEVTTAARAAGIPCIGLLSPSGEQNLPLAYSLLESLEGIDAAYLRRTHAHALGYPADILETERLRIRELSEKDFPVLYAMCSAPETAIWMTEQLSDYETEQARHAAYISNIYPLVDLALWGVFEKTTGKLIGRAGFSLPENGEEAYSLGYLIDTPYRNKGYAKECIPALLTYAKEQGGITIIANIKQNNLPSQRVLEACGYPYDTDAKSMGGILTYRIMLQLSQEEKKDAPDFP